MKPSPVELEVVYEVPRVRYAVMRNVLVAAWLGAPSTRRLQGFRRGLERIARVPGPAGVFSVIAAGAKLDGVDNELLRSDVARTFSKYSSPDAASAVALEGEGFVPAIGRAFLSGAVLIARPSFPVKLFATRAEAAGWVAPRMNHPTLGAVRSEELLDAVGRLLVGLG